MDTIVRVDYWAQPTSYPEWFEGVAGPILVSPVTPPAEYDLATQVKLLATSGGYAVGQDLYYYLKNDYLDNHFLLETCLSLRDAEAIQKKGTGIFQKVFGHVAVYFWRSVIYRRGSDVLYIPYLYVWDNEVRLDWKGLNILWFSHDATAVFVNI